MKTWKDWKIIMTEGGKICSKCKEWKPFSNFYLDKPRQKIKQVRGIKFKIEGSYYKPYYKSECKKCHSANRQDYYCRTYSAEWEKHRISKARQTAKKLNLPFNLTEEYIKSITPPNMICPALGIKMMHGTKEKGNWRSPSLDRIIPELGYVKGNVVIVSFKVNRIKNDANLEELTKITNFYEGVFEKLNSNQIEMDFIA